MVIKIWARAYYQQRLAHPLATDHHKNFNREYVMSGA
jgi:hypothetical protein